LKLEDTDATNELINDGMDVQPVKVDEIQALKRSGASASVSHIRPLDIFFFSRLHHSNPHSLNIRTLSRSK